MPGTTSLRIEHGAVDLEHGLPGETREVAEQPAVETEEQAQALGDGEDELAVGHWLAHVARDVASEHEGPLLVTAGTERPSPAGEGDEELVAAAGCQRAAKTGQS